jgi:hypothetical protein
MSINPNTKLNFNLNGIKSPKSIKRGVVDLKALAKGRHENLT